MTKGTKMGPAPLSRLALCTGQLVADACFHPPNTAAFTCEQSPMKRGGLSYRPFHFFRACA